MKLLPKKEIHNIRADEKRTEIDQGIALAKRIDDLREKKLSEELNFKTWHDGTLKSIQYDIDQLLEEKANLEKQNLEARKKRDELLAPDIQKVKEELASMIDTEQDKREVFISSQQLKEEEQSLKTEKDRIAQLIATYEYNIKEAEKEKQEAINLKELSEREYEMARRDHQSQSEHHEARKAELEELKDSYENGLAVIEIREKEVKEKEVDIIKREQHLKSQQVALRIAMEEVKKYAP